MTSTISFPSTVWGAGARAWGPRHCGGWRHFSTDIRQAGLRIAQLQACGLEVVQDAVPGAQGVWPVILLRMPSQQARDAVLRAHWGGGCGLSLPFVHVLPDYGRYDHVLGAARDDAVSQARDWAQRLLAISNSPWLDDERFADLLDTLAAR
jgi:hypothetical protein